MSLFCISYAILFKYDDFNYVSSKCIITKLFSFVVHYHRLSAVSLLSPLKTKMI